MMAGTNQAALAVCAQTKFIFPFKQNNVRIYFDLKCLRINGKHYVNLKEDIHIASTVRMKKTCLKRNWKRAVHSVYRESLS